MQQPFIQSQTSGMGLVEAQEAGDLANGARKVISLNLDASVAKELRERDEERRRKAVRRRWSGENDANEHELDDAPNEEEEDWNEVLLIPPHLETSVVSSEDGDNASQQTKEEASQVSDELTSDPKFSAQHNEWDEVSMSPPPNLPIVLVQADRLFGFVPASDEEQTMLQEQLQETMWGSNLDEGNDEEDDHTKAATSAESKQCTDQVDRIDNFTSLEFEKQIAELLETGAARHSIDTEKSIPGWIRIQYPPYFCADIPMLSDKSNPTAHKSIHDDGLDVVKTERLWKFVLQGHDIAVVHRLLTLLRNCSRSLSYKANLRHEIVQLAHREHLAHQHQKHKSELAAWKCGRRKDQLDQLYTVQETMQHRLEMACQRLNALQNDLDKTVTEKLRQERLTTGHDVGLEAFDFASTMFSFPTGTFLGGDIVLEGEEDDFPLLDEDDDDGQNDYDEQSNGQEDESDYDASVDGASDDASTVESHGKPAEEIEATAPLTQFTTEAETAVNCSSIPESNIPERTAESKSAQAKRKKASDKKRQRRLENAAKEAEHERRLESAKKDEERMRDACMTDELKVAQAFVSSLEDRIAKADELIETLQEEEWEDEENGTDQSMLVAEEQDIDKASLLDQILAMILGSTPPGLDTDMESHVKFMFQEHKEIVSDWRTTFGRLPPPVQLGLGEAKIDDDKLNESESLDMSSSSKIIPSKDEATKAIDFNVDQMREAFGIENLQTDDWDNDDETVDC